jgi:hypothetical protein
MADENEPDQDHGPVRDPAPDPVPDPVPDPKPAPGPAPTPPAIPDRFWWIPYALGLVVLAGYALMLRQLLKPAMDITVEEVQWSRLVYLFTGVESLAFAAGGFFFGREVNRGRAESAEARASAESDRATRAESGAAAANARGQVLTQQLRDLADGAGEQQQIAPAIAMGAGGGVDPRALRRLAAQGERWFYRG